MVFCLGEKNASLILSMIWNKGWGREIAVTENGVWSITGLLVLYESCFHLFAPCYFSCIVTWTSLPAPEVPSVEQGGYGHARSDRVQSDPTHPGRLCSLVQVRSHSIYSSRRPCQRQWVGQTTGLASHSSATLLLPAEPQNDQSFPCARAMAGSDKAGTWVRGFSAPLNVKWREHGLDSTNLKDWCTGKGNALFVTHGHN